MPSLLLQAECPAPERPRDPDLPRVRWGAFLRGSVYANPVTDLIDRLVYRMENAQLQLPRHLAGRLDFRPAGIVVVAKEEEESRAVADFPYAEISRLTFDTQQVATRPVTTVRFLTPGGEREFQTLATGTGLLPVLRFLLERRVPFREFQSGSRVHLGEGRSYAEIQQLKKDYGLVW